MSHEPLAAAKLAQLSIGIMNVCSALSVAESELIEYLEDRKYMQGDEGFAVELMCQEASGAICNQPEHCGPSVASAIHYPECWDTAAYPTLYDAAFEVGCNSCDCTHNVPSEKNDDNLDMFEQ